MGRGVACGDADIDEDGDSWHHRRVDGIHHAARFIIDPGPPPSIAPLPPSTSTSNFLLNVFRLDHSVRLTALYCFFFVYEFYGASSGLNGP